MISLPKNVTVAVTLAFGLLLATAPISPQFTQAAQAPQAPQNPGPPAPQAPPSGGIRTTVELVVVPVTVKDSRGGLVSDLRQDEFRVLEDGVEQRISIFSVEAVPLSAVVLVDDDLKTKTSAHVKDSLMAVAGGFSAFDEVALARFDAFYTPVLDFTADNDQLITQLKHMDLNSTIPGAGSEPMTAGPTINGHEAQGAPSVAEKPLRAGESTKHMNDAIHAAAEVLRTRGRDRRKVIVVISDGINARNNTFSYDDTLKLLLSADISVYAVGVDAAVLNRGTTAMSHYAHATGGDVYYAAHPEELSRLYAQVSEQARHQYTIGYVPTTDRTKDYHTIEVRIRRPGLTLLARDGYYRIPRP
jgi:Ca-activated chloride channel homolog